MAKAYRQLLGGDLGNFSLDPKSRVDLECLAPVVLNQFPSFRPFASLSAKGPTRISYVTRLRT